MNQVNPNVMFIIGKIGNKEIIKEDLNTFMNYTKKADWTTNPYYKAASNATVSPTFKLNNQSNNTMTKFSENILNNFLVNDTSLDQYYNFIQEIESNNMKSYDKIEYNKQKMANFLGTSSIKEDIIAKLNNNWKNICLTNNELSSILSSHKQYLNSNDYS